MLPSKFLDGTLSTKLPTSEQIRAHLSILKAKLEAQKISSPSLFRKMNPPPIVDFKNIPGIPNFHQNQVTFPYAPIALNLENYAENSAIPSPTQMVPTNLSPLNLQRSPVQNISPMQTMLKLNFPNLHVSRVNIPSSIIHYDSPNHQTSPLPYPTPTPVMPKSVSPYSQTTQMQTNSPERSHSDSSNETTSAPWFLSPAEGVSSAEGVSPTKGGPSVESSDDILANFKAFTRGMLAASSRVTSPPSAHVSVSLRLPTSEDREIPMPAHQHVHTIDMFPQTPLLHGMHIVSL